MTVRIASPRDLPLIAALAEAAPQAAHWQPDHYRSLLESRLVLVAEGSTEGSADGAAQIHGMLIAHAVAGEWELENIVVAPASRRSAIAFSLMQALIERARESHGTSIHLEVRAGNAAAIALYRKSGFAQTGTRKGYYSAPAEDALLFSRDL